jgi:hypothetical protein
VFECDTLLIEVDSEILDKRIAKETPLVKLTLLYILMMKGNYLKSKFLKMIL